MKTEIYFSRPGIICAAGCGEDSLWRGVVSGNQDGIKKIAAASGEEFYAAKIDGSLLKETSSKYKMRVLSIEEAALDQIADSVLKAKNKFGAERIAVCVGSCDNGTELSVAGHRQFFSSGNFPADYGLEIQGADYVATFAAEKFSLEGPALAFSTACSSSAGAIIKAAQLIRSGIADAVVAGGVDIVSDTVLLGFNSLESVSRDITNPFSRNRHGITLGEGAAFFVLSRENFGDAGIPIRLLGWGETSDAHHMTSPDPEGKGARAAISLALKNAGLSPSRIDYVNLHGTGTRLNDSMEAKAVANVFGEDSVACGSTKPVTGHTLGAAGAIEAAVCYEAIAQNFGKRPEEIELPRHVWDGARDESIPLLNFCGEGRYPHRVCACLSSSFAFGGSNACIVLGGADA